MKQLSLIISLLFALLSGGILHAAPLTAPADTLDHYVINGQSADRFDGSQLVGKTIVSYEITLINHPTRGLVRIHEILTEGVSLPPASFRVRVQDPSQQNDPAYVIDGKQVSKKDFEALTPADIKSITVVKNGTMEDVKKYDGWENGVILVETKAGSGRDGKKK